MIGGDILGSKISVGLVYEIEELGSKVAILNSIINSLDDSNGVHSYKYCKDVFGEEWIQSDNTVNMTNEILVSIVSNYFAELTMNTSQFLGDSQSIVIRVENYDVYFGILIDLEESSVQKAGYDMVESRIIQYLSKEFNNYKYDYAFCENEGEIELSPDEVTSSKEELFSVLMKPEGETVKVYKSSWKLDGVSER